MEIHDQTILFTTKAVRTCLVIIGPLDTDHVFRYRPVSSSFGGLLVRFSVRRRSSSAWEIVHVMGELERRISCSILLGIYRESVKCTTFQIRCNSAVVMPTALICLRIYSMRTQKHFLIGYWASAWPWHNWNEMLLHQNVSCRELLLTAVLSPLPSLARRNLVGKRGIENYSFQ